VTRRLSIVNGRSSSAVLVGGVNSPVRAMRQVGASALLVRQGRGARLRAEDGRTYVDFVMGWGPLILGHAHPAVTAAVRQALRRGTVLGFTHPDEAALAEGIAAAVPSVEQVRFTVSGTEACMTAVRLARAATGRRRILVFEGGYHGHGDSLLAGHSAGVPEALSAEVITVPFNDRRSLAEAFAREGTRLACALVEPVAANMGVVPPAEGFLEDLRRLASAAGALLIFDEVVTGFRLAWGGAQARFRVAPDLTVLGKIIGGGLPIGAVGGPRALMRHLAPEGKTYQGGTFAGHPASTAAGLATLRVLKEEAPYGRLDALGQRLARGLAGAAQRAGVPVRINQIGSMLTLFFSDARVASAGDVRRADAARFGRWWRHLFARGILMPPSPCEAAFLSTAHSEALVDRAVQAAAAAFRAAAGETL
jgi:glutamate-1-semialdehyde 2,1-aminomutase